MESTIDVQGGPSRWMVPMAEQRREPVIREATFRGEQGSSPRARFTEALRVQRSDAWERCMSDGTSLAGLFKLFDRIADQVDSLHDSVADLRTRVTAVETLEAEREKDRERWKQRIEALAHSVDELNSTMSSLRQAEAGNGNGNGEEEKEPSGFWKVAATTIAGLVGVAAAAWQTVKAMGGSTP